MSVSKVKKINPLVGIILKKQSALKKIDKEISLLRDQTDEKRLNRESALKELHNKELEGLDDEDPAYFAKRYEQEYDMLQGAKQEMEDLKARFGAAKKRKAEITERICNLRDEIAEAKQPILKLSKTLDNAAWKKAEINLLQSYGLAESLVLNLESEGFKTVGDIVDDDKWKDIPGFGDATQEKILKAVSDMTEVFNEKLEELQKLKAERDGEAKE